MPTEARADRTPALKPTTARRIVERVQTASGLRIDSENTDFLEFRLGRRLNALRLGSYEDYLLLLEDRHDTSELQRLVEHLVTHTTSFFREKAHFDWLAATGLPTLLADGVGHVRPLVVWSGACSSGEELWSAAMVVDGFAQGITGGLRWSLLGTDISGQILRQAERAVYPATDMGGIDPQLLRRYFLRSRPGAAISPQRQVYRVVPELRRRATFTIDNLLEKGDGSLPLADIAFLRNVLIYFSPEDRDRAVRNAVARMRTGGYLILGHSDNLRAVPPGLSPVAVAIFRKE